MKPQLSISLLVSDRIETVEKCLNSLVPILRAIPSELIVVYTGLGQECLEVVQKYTEMIIPFVWCDDFSAARNCGLERAAGEWFLYIDDDEWFEDCSDIISFFKNGNYFKYQSACYTQRNYTDQKGKDYEDISVTRLVKLTPETKFVGRIHEKINYVFEPEKMLSAFVHHYGYINNENDNLRFERNKRLLEKEIEYNPNCISNYLQLAQEYFSERMYAESEICCRKILHEFEGTSEIYYLEWSAVYFVESLKLGRHEESALEEGKKLLASGNLREAAELALIKCILPLCQMYGQQAIGVEVGKRFISNWDYLEERPEAWQKQQILTINRSMILKGSFEAYKNILVCAAHENDFNVIKECLRRLPWREEKCEKELYGFLEWWKQEYDTPEQVLLHCIAQLNEVSDYVALQKALLFEKELDLNNTKKFYNQLGASKNPIIRRQSINLALRQGFSVLPFVKDMELNEWKKLIGKVTENIIFDEFESYSTIMEAVFSKVPVHQIIAEQFFLSRFLLKSNLSEMSFLKALHRYCEKTLKLNHMLYKDIVFDNEMQFCLPIECRIALQFSEVLGWLDGGELKRCIASLKKTVEVYPESGALAKRLIDHITAQLQQKSVEHTAEEFSLLGQAVKEQLHFLIESGQFRTAYPVAEQLCELLPDDLEVLRWKQKLMEHNE